MHLIACYSAKTIGYDVSALRVCHSRMLYLQFFSTTFFNDFHLGEKDMAINPGMIGILK